jgi:hypothetical protein
MSSEQAGPSGGFTPWVLGAVIVAGGVGVVLRLAGVQSAVCSALVLLFLAVAPTVAIYGLLRSFDRFARIILAGTADIVFLTLTATLMLAEGLWSPRGGLVAVVVITLVGLVGQWPPVRRRVVAAAPRRRTDRHVVALAGATDPESGQNR